SLCHAQGHHGGEEEGDPQGDSSACDGRSAAPEDRPPLCAREGQEDADDRRLACGSGQGARAAPSRRCAGDFVILVIAEQRQGKLNRATWETVAAAQQLAGASGASPISIAVAGAGVGAVASELAAAQVKEVVTVEHAALEPYTPDGFTAALQQAIEQLAPTMVLLPHTYQTRDFAPKLAARVDRALVTDVTAVKGDGDDAVFVRPMFQGKLSADVVPQGPPPHLVTFQIGAFRAD